MCEVRMIPQTTNRQTRSILHQSSHIASAPLPSLCLRQHNEKSVCVVHIKMDSCRTA
jgi:hypothetical protein